MSNANDPWGNNPFDPYQPLNPILQSHQELIQDRMLLNNAQMQNGIANQLQGLQGAANQLAARQMAASQQFASQLNAGTSAMYGEKRSFKVNGEPVIDDLDIYDLDI